MTREDPCNVNMDALLAIFRLKARLNCGKFNVGIIEIARRCKDVISVVLLRGLRLLSTSFATTSI